MRIIRYLYIIIGLSLLAILIITVLITIKSWSVPSQDDLQAIQKIKSKYGNIYDVKFHREGLYVDLKPRYSDFVSEVEAKNIYKMLFFYSISDERPRNSKWLYLNIYRKSNSKIFRHAFDYQLYYDKRRELFIRSKRPYY